MEFSVLNHPLKSTAHPIILGIFADGTLTSSGEELNAASQNLIRKVFDVSVLKKAGETSTLFYPQGLATTCLILVALGEKGKLTAKEILTSTRAAFQQVFQHQFPQVVCTLQEALPCAEAISRTIIDSSYRYTQTFGPQNTKKPVALTSVQFTETATTSEALQQGNIIGRAINYAKELGNLPGNICTPTYLAQEAQSIAARHTHNMHIEIFDRAGIEALQMGAFLAVAKGSKEEPRLMVLRYQGHPQSETAPYVLVGKGLTFDAGGISIKPAASMDEMKYDMCGAATVLAVLQAVADLQLPINLIGVIPSCENLPSGTAYKPGDILTSMSGQTIEITNTDAEGRLILCDALTYVERLNPHCVIDIATLTGACITALGHHHSGLFGTHPETIQDLVEAGKRAHDTVWHMPLDEDYQQQLQSNFADMVNSAGAPAGAITAASFLARFTKKYTWAHLDIAGTAWKSGKDKGGTGRPVGLLIEFLRQRATSSK